MSRHSTQVNGCEVIVGWDPPMLTFFAQVYDPTIHEDANPVIWVGLDKRVPTITALRSALGEPWSQAVGMFEWRLREEQD